MRLSALAVVLTIQLVSSRGELQILESFSIGDQLTHDLLVSGRASSENEHPQFLATNDVVAGEGEVSPVRRYKDKEFPTGRYRRAEVPQSDSQSVFDLTQVQVSPLSDTRGSRSHARAQRIRRDAHVIGKLRHNLNNITEANVVEAKGGLSIRQRFGVSQDTASPIPVADTDRSAGPWQSGNSTTAVVTAATYQPSIAPADGYHNTSDSLKHELEELFGATRCNRGTHMITVTKPGCESKQRDVGWCTGFCRSWFIPQYGTPGHTPDTWFRRGKCKCCSHRGVRLEPVSLQCELGLPQVVLVPIVTACHCVKCRSN